MYFIAKLAACAIIRLAALISGANGIPTADVRDPTTDAVPAYFMTRDQMMNWIASLDGEVTYIGEPLNPLARPAAVETTTVMYCSTRRGNVCAAPCTVYTGGTRCLNAPDTNCLAATTNVAFCDTARCTGTCRNLSTCEPHLDDGFCFTPGTRSILVPATLP
ncbi:hypothetical protein C8Q76DRAFT_406092 [Earliella scabrosa]|nr:hypothetical protein C8Q76DRAFT_406092 [Earliella scabrosa]